jgi:hypothetical protein
MQDQIIQKVRVQQQGCVNNNIYRERPWESIDDKQQATNDVRQEGLTRTNIDPPRQRIGTGRYLVGYQASRGKGPYMDNGGVIMSILIVTRKKDGEVHLYGQTMPRRMSPQQGNLNKRRNNINSCNRKSATKGDTIDTRAGNRLRI